MTEPLSEPTLFERSSPGRQGYELPPLEVPKRAPLAYARTTSTDLPELGELDVVRHFTRLSSWNDSIDLGNATRPGPTRYLPRIGEEIARLPGFADGHPASPIVELQGALAVMHSLETVLCQITGLDECSAQPPAGLPSRCAGLYMIRAFHEKHNSSRARVLVPEREMSVHARAVSAAGYEAIPLRSGNRGILELDEFEAAIASHGREIAALLFTNPNSQGLFESHVVEISGLLHGIGAQVLLDGANLGSILAVARPREMGVDLLSWDLHRAFATPLGVSGPDAGPLLARAHLAPFLPAPRIRLRQEKYLLEDFPQSVGRIGEGIGNFGACLRALAYILHQGGDGLKRVSRASALNASYVRHRLSAVDKDGAKTAEWLRSSLAETESLRELDRLVEYQITELKPER
jgi:glycine dehydrogenase subunit 2